MKVSIIIPNFNGAKLLEKNLPKVLEANPDEVIVIDDASSDNSIKIIQDFPAIKLIQNKKNLGFAKSVNFGAEAASGEIIVLLNNDAIPEKNFLNPVLPHFERSEKQDRRAYLKNDKVFAVSFSEPQFSWAKADFVNGFIIHSPGPRINTPHISFWASGGSAAFAKEKWKMLGGFDTLYYPFFWEDIDISFRAWKRGWEVWWEPASVVHHKHGATIETHFSKSYREYISVRNQLIFIWKNITDEELFNDHKAALLKQLVRGQMLKPFLAALLKLPEILKKRTKEKEETKFTDEEIFTKFN